MSCVLVQRAPARIAISCEKMRLKLLLGNEHCSAKPWVFFFTNHDTRACARRVSREASINPYSAFLVCGTPAHLVVGVGACAHGPEPGQPKVGDPQLAVLGHQHVAGLEVAVDDAVVVQELLNRREKRKTKTAVEAKKRRS